MVTMSKSSDGDCKKRRWPWILLAVVLVCGGGAAAYIFWPLSLRGEALDEKDRAPEISLADERGRTWTLAELTRDGGAVLVFYRGHW